MLYPLAAYSKPGYCSGCDGWLGEPNLERPELADVEEPASATAKQLGTILEMLPTIDPATVRGSLCQNLNAYFEQVADGDISALAKLTRCKIYNLRCWLDGTHAPRLENVVRVAQSFNVAASSLFAMVLPSPMEFACAKEAIARVHRSVNPRSRQASEIRQALLDALSDEVAPSLSMVGQRLGFSATPRLYRASRSLCQQIVVRYRETKGNYSRRQSGIERIRVSTRIKQALKESLNSSKPRSPDQIARELGYANGGSIRNQFPDLCSAVRKKIAENKQLSYAKTRQSLNDALNQDQALSLSAVCRSMGYLLQTVQFREPELCSKIIERNRQHLEKQKIDLGRKMEAALIEVPPPPIYKLCRRLGVEEQFMRKYYPAMMRAVVARHRMYVENRTKNRNEDLADNVRRIAADLHSQGIYPSQPRIVELLPVHTRVHWGSTGEAVRTAQKMLGIRT
jgi:hypothetical protein